MACILSELPPHSCPPFFPTPSPCQAPVLKLPSAALSLDEDNDFVIAGVSVEDADADVTPGATLGVTLQCSSGSTTLNGTVGLSFPFGDGVHDRFSSFVGSLADINAALNGLKYTPALDWHGVDSLLITVNDQGNTGAGGQQITNVSVPILVRAINDRPHVSVPSQQTTDEEVPPLPPPFCLSLVSTSISPPALCRVLNAMAYPFFAMGFTSLGAPLPCKQLLHH